MSFFLDIETLAVESTTVILSFGMCFGKTDSTYSDLVKDSIFVKFNAKEQIEKYKRTTSKDTLDWWNKQDIQARQLSLLPSENDVTVIEGFTRIKNWMKQFPDYKNQYCWTRGNLDQLAIDSLANAAGIERLIPFWFYRDIRTALMCLKTTEERGYCKVKYPYNDEFDFDKLMKDKHDPCIDVRLDCAMLLWGI